MAKTLMAVWTIWVFCYTVASAQDYPFLKKIDVDCHIRFDAASRMYYYSYDLYSDSRNTGKVEVFEMDISRAPSSVSFDTTGLRFYSHYGEESFRRSYQVLRHHIVPVGIPNLPSGWGTTWGEKWTVHLSNLSGSIRPNDSVRDLVVMSKGLPGIRRLTIKPDFQDDLLFPSIEDTSYWKVPATRFIDSVRTIVNFYDWTVGPTAPPENLVPAAWLDTLIAYKHQSLALGWILNKGIITSLDQKLDNAKQQLQRSNISAAKNVLQAFVNEVEALNKQGNQITSEAYALLKFNAEYLMSKL